MASSTPDTTSSSESSFGPALKFPPVVKHLEEGRKMPVCVLFVGMAGSGKTSLVSQLEKSLCDRDRDAETEADGASQEEEEEEEEEDSKPSTTPGTETRCYCINLDPATINMPFDVSIDIRDTVNYRQVMTQHKLGPNGAIMTSLNLFVTKFDQVMAILEQRAGYQHDREDAKEEASPKEGDAAKPESSEPAMDYILVDTPGQIEAFTWSASGSIVCESLASAFPTVLCFVVDTVRCTASPNTFMSNMLYACSMLYRTRLPLVVCFNKTDVTPHTVCMEWMRDHEVFQQALDDMAESAGFYGSLTRSLSLVLDEFYSNFANACGVSAVTGQGIPEFWETVQKAATQDFPMDYVEDLKNRIEEQHARKQAMARSGMQRLQRDIDLCETEEQK
jgi:GTPase SAR1 family protein